MNRLSSAFAALPNGRDGAHICPFRTNYFTPPIPHSFPFQARFGSLELSIKFRAISNVLLFKFSLQTYGGVGQFSFFSYASFFSSAAGRSLQLIHYGCDQFFINMIICF
jgi:hypothetical protein